MTAPIDFQIIREPSSQSGLVILPLLQGNIDISSWTSVSLPSNFTGKRDQWWQTYDAQESKQLILLGLGDTQQLATAYQTFRRLLVRQRSLLAGKVVMDLRNLDESLVFQAVLGAAMSDYFIGAYKTEESSEPTIGTVDILVSEDIHENLVSEALQVAETVKRVCHLVDAPANVKTPQYLAQWALDSAGQFGYQVEVLELGDLKNESLHALMAVGQGSEHPPVLIKINHRHPERDSTKVDLGLVGKGVTFDTGGLSLKKPNNMHYMKSDMGGAAAVLGAMELISKLQLPINVTAVIPVAENSVDAASFRPGDVISSYAGKSIEVIDTDAEGRLILADALSYIQKNYNPETLVDLATLTGSCVAALGYEAAGLFSNNLALTNALTVAGNQVGERVWSLPLWDSYADALHSDIADVKNLSGKPVAGAITAAKFLEYFVNDQQAWAHLDIAGVAFGDTDHAKMKSATGFGVRLLVEFAKSLMTQ